METRLISTEIKMGAHIEIYKRTLAIFADRRGLELNLDEFETKQDVFYCIEELVQSEAEVKEYRELLEESRLHMLEEEMLAQQQEILHPTRAKIGRATARIAAFFDANPEASV